MFSGYLDANFPNGILIVQDAFFLTKAKKVPQNFKFLDLGEVMKLVGIVISCFLSQQ